MLPHIDKNMGYLPPGVHFVPWTEVRLWLGTNDHRLRLLTGLQNALVNLAIAGCRSVLLNGSFISNKRLPADYDGAWDPWGVDIDLLAPVLLDFSDRRRAMKAKFGGELFPAAANAGGGVTFREFFQTDRDGVEKGIVEINPGSLL